MSPLVSIIVPAYNRASLIEETLESIRLQTYPAIEVIVVDDGSTDETVSVINKWIEANREIKAVCYALGKNAGKSSAVNYALDRFSGEFAMILDSDDLLLPDGIASEVRYLLARTDVGMVSARPYKLDGNRKTNITFDVFKDEATFDDLVNKHGDLLLNGNTVISSTVMMRRDVVQHTGHFRPDLRYTHDYDYWIRVSRSYKISYLAQPVIYYRVNSVGSSSIKRFGTFREICALLLEEQPLYPIARVRNALLRETRGNAWLAYHDANYIDMIRIVLHGILTLFRTLVQRPKK